MATLTSASFLHNIYTALNSETSKSGDIQNWQIYENDLHLINKPSANGTIYMELDEDYPNPFEEESTDEDPGVNVALIVAYPAKNDGSDINTARQKACAASLLVRKKLEVLRCNIVRESYVGYAAVGEMMCYVVLVTGKAEFAKLD